MSESPDDSAAKPTGELAGIEAIVEVVAELQELPPENLQALRLMVQQMEAYSGPLPHPSILEGYEKVLPGAADRIIKQFELQSANRRELELDTIKSKNRRASVGQYLAAGLAFLIVFGAVGLLWNGRPVEGLSAIVLALGSLVGVFVWGRREERRERVQKIRAIGQAASPATTFKALAAAIEAAQNPPENGDAEPGSQG